MPLNLASVSLATRQARQAEQSVQALEAELQARREQAEAARAQAEQARKQETARVRQVTRDATEQVARLERELPKVVEQAATLAAEAGTPAHQLRVFARALLLGNLRTGHESGPHALVLDRDPAAALLFGANQQAANVLGQMTAAGVDGDPVARWTRSSAACGRRSWPGSGRWRKVRTDDLPPHLRRADVGRPTVGPPRVEGGPRQAGRARGGPGTAASRPATGVGSPVQAEGDEAGLGSPGHPLGSGSGGGDAGRG
jgi:hypothetical protein